MSNERISNGKVQSSTIEPAERGILRIDSLRSQRHLYINLFMTFTISYKEMRLSNKELVTTDTEE
ncbi:MAG TPA: hypothetical protein ACFYEC_07720, partial [Candidatus Brocadiaceae bacterium]